MTITLLIPEPVFVTHDETAQSFVSRGWETQVTVGGAHSLPGCLVTHTYESGFCSAAEQDVAAIYPAQTYQRLAAVKRQYDPGNLFARNHNIRPH